MIKKIKLKNQDEIFLVLGEQDTRLKAFEKEFKVEIYVRYNEDGEGAEISISGVNSRVDKCADKIKKLLSNKDIVTSLQKNAYDKPFKDGIIFYPDHAAPIKPRTKNQQKYIETIFANDLIISLGPAGTGKTFLACACALRALELGMISRVIISRPIVEAGEKLGFLPGDINEKVDPYLRPVYDAFNSMLGIEKFRAMRYNGTLEIVPLAYMRGRTLENAFIILDEAQNTLPEQMKMFLTRMGSNSKMIINGDPTQIDLSVKKESGLITAAKILKNIDGIAVVEFEEEDIVRHPIVKAVIEAYAKAEKRK
ncbi:Phosphate starvation-inducible protein family [Elusimicrobium minutum Pei191]|uniref:PhoH-like protein n=1 Tax=Elusimicrobium minutum (strain Pei191) TaxID=445932 RepID=B2KAT5_ELUMP|nr:PhoH family protein [Elusimicrobium minutum]ACC97631.1 Phosphate starvation-inducible protein family [Elusimicrobium minutum Pei191]